MTVLQVQDDTKKKLLDSFAKYFIVAALVFAALVGLILYAKIDLTGTVWTIASAGALIITAVGLGLRHLYATLAAYLGKLLAILTLVVVVAASGMVLALLSPRCPGGTSAPTSCTAADAASLGLSVAGLVFAVILVSIMSGWLKTIFLKALPSMATKLFANKTRGPADDGETPSGT